VDYVSEESALAGGQAAAYVGGMRRNGQAIPLKAGFGVRYTVPAVIDPGQMGDAATVRLRVDNEYRNYILSVYFDNTPVMKFKKTVLAPGEMETMRLSKKLFAQYPGCQSICVLLEKNESRRP
jgi:hypothetical protein